MMRTGSTERRREARGASLSHLPFGDGELIQSCKLLADLVDQFHGPDNAYAAAEASGCSDEDLEAAGHAHSRLYDRLSVLKKKICETAAVSLDGILAKMRAAEIVREAEGTLDPDATENLHRSYVADVRALS